MSVPVRVCLFVRVSKQSQNYDRQVSDLTPVADRQGWAITHIIHETGSATKRRLADRAELRELLRLCQTGQIDKVLVTEFSRLGRQRGETPMVIEQIAQSNVSIYAHNLGMETRLPNGRPNPAMGLIVAIMVESAAQETERNAERIVSGQQEAKRKGVHIGRPAGSTTSDVALIDKHKLVAKDLRAGLSVRHVAAIRAVSKNTVSRVASAIKRCSTSPERCSTTPDAGPPEPA